jgi:ABC-2 type transport system ATP-binding protein
MRVAAAVRGPDAFGRIDGALRRVGLGERADEKVARYSQGMRQRLGVARCLLADPELLILDEPTNGLDPAGIIEFREMIRALVGEGRSVFLSSHLLGEVEKACDAVAIIDAGRIVRAGAISELTHSARSELIVECGDPARAAALLAESEAVLEITPEGEALRLILRRADAGPALNRRLVEAGIEVSRLEPVRASLEQSFLEVTTRLEAVA